MLLRIIAHYIETAHAKTLRGLADELGIYSEHMSIPVLKEIVHDAVLHQKRNRNGRRSCYAVCRKWLGITDNVIADHVRIAARRKDSLRRWDLLGEALQEAARYAR